ncbi:ParA family protein [Fusobacterium polymorphum]|uniref:ATPase n=3 Tax=Fusobacterium TaxID=848 RepID=A0A0S2ZQP3_9FUSO|nr:ATPase [Fusobacterium hwasookii ChDC F206]ALQ41243.1 ATPase [Fusobacterium hwasookii ChDC F174]ASG29698.1 ParA family protein [Fusobacterium polymorphum]
MTLPNTTKKNVILFKINKGGVGKTFLTSQVGVGLTLAEPNKKVLIITSDSQNNILNFLDKNDSDISNGLIKDVLYGKGEYIKLRKNLYFLPLENARFGKIFLEKLKEWLDFKRREYDYILIDSIPTMKIDEEFVNLADYFVIPAFFDEATTQGIVNLITEIDKDKIIAIQGNRYRKRKIENKYKESLENLIKQTNIMMNDPIPDLSFILTMLDNKKSIFEYSNIKIKEVQKIFVKLIQKIIEVVNNG